jgi:hypothetical protein
MIIGLLSAQTQKKSKDSQRISVLILLMGKTLQFRKNEKNARTRRMRPARPVDAETWRTNRHAKSRARLHKHCPKHQPRKI